MTKKKSNVFDVICDMTRIVEENEAMKNIISIIGGKLTVHPAFMEVL